MPQQPEDRERTGLIGIGLLGSALSDRLLTAGHAVIGFDDDPIQMKQLEASGGNCAASAASREDGLFRIPDASLLAIVLASPCVAVAILTLRTTEPAVINKLTAVTATLAPLAMAA